MLQKMRSMSHEKDGVNGRHLKPTSVLKRRSSFSTNFNITKSGPPGKQIVFADDRGASICKVSKTVLGVGVFGSYYLDNIRGEAVLFVRARAPRGGAGEGLLCHIVVDGILQKYLYLLA